MIRMLVGSIALLLAMIPPARQTSPQASTQPPRQVITSSATAVVIDVVVRDGKGRPVIGLTAADFTLAEDGVTQKIGDLVEVAPPARIANQPRKEPPAARPGAEAGARATSPPLATAPRFQAIVFDRLSPEARSQAYKGALAALQTLEEGDLVGVFLADQGLVTVQTYTNDRAKLESAIRDLAVRAGASFDRATLAEDFRQRDARGNVQPGDADPSVPVVASAESVGRPVDTRTSGNSGMTRDIAAVLAATANSWDTVQRTAEGYATTNALMALTNGLAVLPGRKSVVFFAEGIAIPDAVLPHFRNVVATANRANVSFYTIDSAGLRVHSQDAVTGRAVRAMGEAGFVVTADGSNASSLRMLEGNEDYLRRDPRTSLTLLAQQTGGFLVENTNDLGSAFRRVDTDRRYYYLLTYAPTNKALDGTWRSVAVSVPGRKVEIRARDGYLAVPGAATLPLLSYEAPALTALATTPMPTALPARAAALVFPGSGSTDNRIAVLAATDLSALRFDEHDGLFQTDFTILARILDNQGTVVRKGSQPYRLSGPAADLARARAGDVLFFRQPSLPPGDYTLEVAVHDALAGKDGVRRVPFSNPAASAARIAVSSLVVIRRAEHVEPGERQPENPLFLDDVLLYPNLGEPIRGSRDLALTCYVEIAGLEGAAPPATVELWHGERRLANGPFHLPTPEAGRIRYLGEIGIGPSLEGAGDYLLRLVVGTSSGSVTREASFTIVP